MRFEYLFFDVHVKVILKLLYVSLLIFRIGHDNKGGFAPWYLESVTIENIETTERVHYTGKVWIDKKNGFEVEFPLPSGITSIQTKR